MTFWDKLGSAESKLTKKSTSFMKARNKLFENPMFFRYVLQNVQIRFDIVTIIHGRRGGAQWADPYKN